ncbi:hypothetical protein FAM09_21970 [Niastella caeni]|uniref:FAS1 domain-containing protein n=1 Tax=Niastella caeni TaxID=2569763 RepID=A0A4V4H0C6_9BACT|nr:fasciclin domain-containing protein [Niastella caeni]THU36056.1 hypothetical protein FAM09_21970 [Niastella caeni]
MGKSLQAFFLLVTSCLLLVNCRKKQWEEFYERPGSLEPPIYQQLEANGNFKQLLSCIDKAGYKNTLSAAGFWTLFAPNDSAFNNDPEFKTFLKSRNISDISAIDPVTAQMIVQYLLVYNAFEKDRLDDFQSVTGWVENSAFKRRTAYYTGFYSDTTLAGQPVKAIASNRNNTTGTNYYVTSDNNNKYIPFFTSDYFSAKGLSSGDYNYFYPTSTYTGFNVGNAKVIQQDIAAENGVIHFIDRVVTPQPSIDQYIKTKPEFSEFKKLFDQFMVQFVLNNDASRRYQVLTGSSDNVMVKVYNTLLAFSPNNENHLKLQDNDGQREGWTMFAPQNDTLMSYINRVLLENYPSVSSLPLPVIADLLNAHMWQSTVWPSKFSSTYNYLGETAQLNNQSNIIDKKILSNGFFYGTNKINEPNVFSTVYGKAYLNPNYSIMTRLLNYELRDVITNPNARFTIFMIPDSVLAKQGYSYNVAGSEWRFVNPANGVLSINDSNRINLIRILNSGIIETPQNELNNLGTPGFSGIIGSFGSEYIRFDGNQIITAGTKDRGLTVTFNPSQIKTAKNGKVVYLNNLLFFSYATIAKHLEILGTPTTSEYNLFWNYLKNSTSMYDAANSIITGTVAGSFYTLFIPNNAAVRQAITDGLLPGTAAAPNFTPTGTAEKVMVEKFLQYHILDKKSVIADRRDEGAFNSLLKNSAGDAVPITIAYPGGTFELTDVFGRKARLVNSQSNQLSNRTVIHLLDNYLKYY